MSNLSVVFTKFDAVIFDMDGLLVDTEKLSYDSFITIAQANKQQFLIEDYQQLIGRNAETGINILRDLLSKDIDAKKFKADWLGEYRKLLADGVDLKPGAKPILERLTEMKIPRGVATSSSAANARTVLRQVGLLKFIPHLTGGDEVAAGKPAPDVYLDIAKKLGVKASRCIAFEDSETGVVAAFAAGMRVIQIPDIIGAKRAPRPPNFYLAKSLYEGARLIGIDL